MWSMIYKEKILEDTYAETKSAIIHTTMDWPEKIFDLVSVQKILLDVFVIQFIINEF